MHIVIIGATGLIGSALYKKLSHNDKIQKITLLTRRELQVESSKIEVLNIGEFSVDKITDLSIDGDIYVNCLGTTINTAGSQEAFTLVDLDFVEAFGQLASQDDAKAFFSVSALGAKLESRIFYNRIKGEMEVSLMALGFPSLYLLRPSLLIGKRAEKRTVESLGILAFRLLDTITPGGAHHKLGTKVEDITSYIAKEIFQLEPEISIVEYF